MFKSNLWKSLKFIEHLSSPNDKFGRGDVNIEMFCFLTVYLEFTLIYIIQCMVLQAFYILLDFSEELIMISEKN